MNLIVLIIWMTPSKAYFQDFQLGISFVDSYLLPRSPEEQKVIQNMTYPSIIFHNSDWGGNFLKKSEIYFYITW